MRLAPSVYAVTSAPPNWERQMAVAILSFPIARVAGQSAAHLHRLDGFGPGKPVVMVPYGGNARSPLARVIRSRFYDQIAWLRVKAFETTSVAETVFTLAADLQGGRLAAVLDESLLTGRASVSDYESIFDRVVGARARGAGRLRRLIEERHPDEYGVDSTYLERLLERVLDDPRIPPATREHPFNLNNVSSRVDALIDDWSLVVEADSRRWHARVGDFEADRRRDNTLAARGLVVVRLTYSMLKRDPEECVQTIINVGRHR